MMSNISFSRFVYLDTNIYSHLAQNTHLWNRLLDFLLTNDLCLALSSANLAELADATDLHATLTDLLILLPSAAVKTWDAILDEEVESHPQRRQDSLLLYPLNQLLLQRDGHETLLGWFTSEKLAEARRQQLAHAKQMRARHDSLKGNFPLSKSGKYTARQSGQFADFIVIQWLANTHRSFLASFKDKSQDLHTEVFLSIRLFALVIFYKYYLGRREPDKLSDFGDLGHLSALPYCKLAIVERDLCNVLDQIKRHHDVLDSTMVRNVDFFRDWEWKGARRNPT
ncbi:MAG: hypothetical protein H5T64_03515 [Chloroflexi bacterium]|nr:hypothetical protein [Chloroflexota bacterium]